MPKLAQQEIAPVGATYENNVGCLPYITWRQRVTYRPIEHCLSLWLVIGDNFAM